MRRLAAALALLLATVASTVSAEETAGADPAAPGREVLLPPEEVKDTFFAYLIGILERKLDVTIGSATLRDVLTEFRRTITLPFDRVSLVRHLAPRQGVGSLEITFDAPMDIPVPFSILWYHPGRIRSTTFVRFRERSYPAATLDGNKFDAIYSFRLAEGSIVIDVDDWIDVLLGDIVDDLDVRLLAIVRWRGAWRCLLGGTGRGGKRVIAAFDFARNWIVFPVPNELSRLGLALWSGQVR